MDPRRTADRKKERERARERANDGVPRLSVAGGWCADGLSRLVRRRLPPPLFGRARRRSGQRCRPRRSDGHAADERQYRFLGRPAHVLPVLRAAEVRQAVHGGPALPGEQVVPLGRRRAALQVRRSVRPEACEQRTVFGWISYGQAWAGFKIRIF